MFQSLLSQSHSTGFLFYSPSPLFYHSILYLYSLSFQILYLCSFINSFSISALLFSIFALLSFYSPSPSFILPFSISPLLTFHSVSLLFYPSILYIYVFFLPFSSSALLSFHSLSALLSFHSLSLLFYSSSSHLSSLTFHSSSLRFYHSILLLFSFIHPVSISPPFISLLRPSFSISLLQPSILQLSSSTFHSPCLLFKLTFFSSPLQPSILLLSSLTFLTPDLCNLSFSMFPLLSFHSPPSSLPSSLHQLLLPFHFSAHN